MRSLVLAWLVAASSACAAAPTGADPPRPVSTADAEREIASVLDDFHDAAAKADEARYFGHLVDASVFLGTDATERWDKAAFLEFARPYFAKGKAWSFRATRRAVDVDPRGDVAWFDEDLATEKLGPCRGSGVVARRGGRWVILQYNLTVTVPNDRFDAVKEAAGAAEIVAPPKGDPLDAVAWLSGAWTGTTKDGETFEEVWMPPRGGVMVGAGRSSKDGETTFFEFLRIEHKAGGVVYVAQPLGRPPTEFKRAAGAPNEIVFENPHHDWPKRIRYRIEDGRLHVRVEGAAAERVEAWTMAPAVIGRGPAPASSAAPDPSR
jgi:hypothetical protein